MKVNVNEFNQILSYEGTPEEIAEFVSTGIFGEFFEEEVEECDEPVVTYTEPADDDITDDFKTQIRKELDKSGIELTDEEFEDAFKKTMEIVDLVRSCDLFK